MEFLVAREEGAMEGGKGRVEGRQEKGGVEGGERRWEERVDRKVEGR